MNLSTLHNDIVAIIIYKDWVPVQRCFDIGKFPSATLAIQKRVLKRLSILGSTIILIQHDNRWRTHDNRFAFNTF